MSRCFYSSRMTVEECKSISTKFLNEHHFFDGGVRQGEYLWSYRGRNTDKMRFAVSTCDAENYIRFQYKLVNHQTGENIEMDYKVRIVSTPCNYGGKRWWFICPLVVNNQNCSRRVGILYLGPGHYFGCRHCLNLTYRSSKESHTLNPIFEKLKGSGKRKNES